MSVGTFFRSDADFQCAWHEVGNPNPERLTLSQLTRVEDTAREVGHLLRHTKFKMFLNAGTPMIERRYATRRYELLFRPQPTARADRFPPFTVHCIVCESRLLEHRQLFGNTASGQLAVVAQANAGQLAIPPGYWIWNADPIQNAAGEVARWLEDHVVPWFRMIEDGMEAPVDFLLGRVSYIPKDTALELMLIVYGKEEAWRQLRKVLRSDQALAGALESPRLGGELARFAALVSQFQLLNTAF